MAVLNDLVHVAVQVGDADVEEDGLRVGMRHEVGDAPDVQVAQALVMKVVQVLDLWKDVGVSAVHLFVEEEAAPDRL